MASSVQERAERFTGPTAELNLRIIQDRVEGLYIALTALPEVHLYEGKFPDPFSNLTYAARLQRNQLLLTAAFGLREGFSPRTENTVGSEDDLAPFLKRYPESQFSPDRKQLVVFRDGQVHGVIARVSEDTMVIQQGGQAGNIVLPENTLENTPVNDLGLALNDFNTLVQRYVGSIWRTSSEDRQKHLTLILNVPALPEGAQANYFSIFELVVPKFREHPRPVDLEEIGGYTPVKTLVRGLMLDLTNPDASRSLGTQPFSNKFVLITGREGTGKSLFPKAMDVMLKNHFGDKYEHFRLPLGDMLLTYGVYTATVIETMFEQIRLNNKRRLPTLLHLDNLDALIPPNQSRDREIPVSSAEFHYYQNTLNPIFLALRQFGRDLGGNSYSVIVYGESRMPRSELPDSIRQTFRRTFHLEPDVKDLADILRMQIRMTRGFAEKTEHDPFMPDIDSQVDKIAASAEGATGRDVQQAILKITDRRKAIWDGQTDIPITAEEITGALNEVLITQSTITGSRRRAGLLAAAGR